MLVGRPPFSGSSFALMRSHTDTPPPPLHDLRPDVPPAMEAAVMRMLAKTPEERFPSLADALVSLGAVQLSHDDPLHAELQGLAAAAERLNQLADIVRTPASPVPKTRERPRQAVASVAPATAPVGNGSAPAVELGADRGASRRRTAAGDSISEAWRLALGRPRCARGCRDRICRGAAVRVRTPRRRPHTSHGTRPRHRRHRLTRPLCRSPTPPRSTRRHPRSRRRSLRRTRARRDEWSSPASRPSPAPAGGRPAACR